MVEQILTTRLRLFGILFLRTCLVPTLLSLYGRNSLRKDWLDRSLNLRGEFLGKHFYYTIMSRNFQFMFKFIMLV